MTHFDKLNDDLMAHIYNYLSIPCALIVCTIAGRTPMQFLQRIIIEIVPITKECDVCLTKDLEKNTFNCDVCDKTECLRCSLPQKDCFNCKKPTHSPCMEMCELCGKDIVIIVSTTVAVAMEDVAKNVFMISEVVEIIILNLLFEYIAPKQNKTKEQLLYLWIFLFR